MGAAPVPPLTSGVVIDGRYEIVRPLGAGGMGEVYAARRKSLGDEVALKRLLPHQDTPTNRARFATEAQAAAHIRHPNVIQVFDYGEDAAVGPYLVMEKLDGPTLAEELAEGPMPLGRALWVFSAVCAAVEAGHRRGIVHRDLKPANVMIAPTDDGRQVVKVLDFGLAVDLRLPERDITTPGAVIGTVAYMAPEQTEGNPASARSDVFALGVMLYEMVSGQLPFQGQSSLDTLMAINGGRYRPLKDVVPDATAGVIDAVEGALARDPGDRPDSPERLAQLAAAGLAIMAPPARPYGPTRSRPMPAVRASRVSHPTKDDDTERALPVYARFVGRAAELARLDEALGAALAGRPPLVLVTGDAGVGKSRLVERFASEARERGALALTGRFFDYTASRPPPLETFVTMLASCGPAGEQAAAQVQDSLDAAGDDARWSAFAAIADGLAGQAAARPLVLTLEDLQWASRVDLDLIDHLHRSLGPRATLIVATARHAVSADVTAWRARRTSAITEVPVAPFDETEVREWLEAVFKGIRLGALDTRRLSRTTSGNPFALVEITRHLQSRGELMRDEAGWKLRGLSTVELPDSVAAVVRVRLGELAAPHRAVLETAAVLGEEFRATTLAAACGADERTLDDALDAGFALRLISDHDVTVGNDYRFTTSLVRQVLYDELPARARRRTHREVARALGEIYGTTDDRFAHIFGYHHHAVGAWPEALELNVRAAAEGMTRGDLDMAQAAIARADEAARQLTAGSSPPEPVQVARLDYLAGAVGVLVGELEASCARLERAIAGATAQRIAGLAIDARIELARAFMARGDLARATSEAAQAAEEATAADDPARALGARVMAAEARNRAGAIDATAIDALVGACEGAPATLRARALLVRAWQRLKAGRFAAAEADAVLAGDLARGAGRLELVLRAISTQSAVRSEAGDNAGSMAASQEALVMSRRVGDRRREGICLANLGEGWVDLGEARRGHEHFAAALQIFIDIGDRACEGDCRVNVGRALLALGRAEEGIAMLERAAEMCAATGRIEYEGIAYMLLGEAREQREEHAAARAAFERALVLFARIDFNQRWRAELGLARTLATLGDAGASRSAAQRARAQLQQQRASIARGTDPAGLDAALTEADDLATAD
ncbi:MAG TPA: protein kinase [Kofleriaceae bacterium]|nr:protein kinase [Kofleriaceae bacterium]